ncbi:MAG TPA: hypothetical protein VF476_00525 [Chitinophagaceae bacterium]
MQLTIFKRNAGQIYLSLVPFVATFFAFATGHVSYKIYLPIWIINVCLMITAAWFLGARVIKNNDTEKKHLAVVACLLLAPTLLSSIFGGMGAPPDTVKEWVTTATEQQIRFSFLIISGILIGLGLILLREKLKQTKGNFYAQLGFAAIIIALPILVFNMSFWHSFALETYKIKIASVSEKTPEWFSPVRNQVWILSVVEVSLTYLAIIAFVAALKSANWFRKIPSRIYIIISLLAIVCILLYPLYPGSTVFSGFPYYPFMIPAIPFFLIYFIGVNLLRKAGTNDQ